MPFKNRAQRKAYKKEYDKKYYANTLPYQFHKNAKGRAKLKKLPCTITEEEIKDLLDSTPVCPILGVPLEMYTDYAPSLDRKHNEQGYTKENCWIISRKANTMKAHSSSAERVLFAFWVLKTHLKNVTRRMTSLLELLQTHYDLQLTNDVLATKAVLRPVAAQV